MTSENNDCGFTDRHSENAVIVIEPLCQSLIRRYKACPAFVAGSIKDAFKLAFRSRVFKKCRPLLIYIHHDRSKSINRFCSDLFCSEYLIEFLRENYIVWSWDITDESNKNILIKIWKELFSDESIINFSMDQCPMLIGIMRRPSNEDDPFVEPSYEFEILLIGDGLVRTSEELNLERLFDQLIVFKEEFDENEQNYPFDFVEKTGFCRDIILEIAEYLPLNEGVTIFSIAILPLLWNCNIRLPIVEPTEQFMKTMIQKIKHEQIVSLRIKADHFQRTIQLAPSDTFKNVKSLTLDNFQKRNQICDIRRYFPSSTSLSVRYNERVDFHTVCKIFQLIPNSIRRFEVHCDSVRCSHYCLELLFTGVNHFNTTIKYLVLNVGHTSLSLVNNCKQGHYKCILRTITDFIRIMSNIRCVRVIVNKGNLETLLDITEWTNLVERCPQLDKITLNVVTNMSQDTHLTQKIEEIQNNLHNNRESIKFQVEVNYEYSYR